MHEDSRVVGQQQAEITEYAIYLQLARLATGDNRRVLEQVAAEELRHYGVWRSITSRDLKPRSWRVRLYVWLARLFGLSFALKLMEGGETRAQALYRELAPRYPQLAAIGLDEKRHEKTLIDLLKDERLAYAGAVVLGLNDALVELTGTLAGLTLAFRNGSIIAVTGLIMGIAAALSMAASGYLAAQESEQVAGDPIKSAIYTGVAYLITVAVLIVPYFIFPEVFIALAAMLGLTIAIIGGYTFYISVAKEVPFGRRFARMTAISVGVAVISFGIGWLVKRAVGVDL